MNEKHWMRCRVSSSGNLKEAERTKIEKRPRRNKWAGVVTLVLGLSIGGAVGSRRSIRRGMPRIGILFRRPYLIFCPGSKHFANGCASLGTSKGKTSLLSTDMQKGHSNGCLIWQASCRLKVDVIVTAGPGILAAKKASSKIPIVFGSHRDPVGGGIVSSLARPGGNITGLS